MQRGETMRYGTSHTSRASALVDLSPRRSVPPLDWPEWSWPPITRSGMVVGSISHVVPSDVTRYGVFPFFWESERLEDILAQVADDRPFQEKILRKLALNMVQRVCFSEAGVYGCKCKGGRGVGGNEVEK